MGNMRRSHQETLAPMVELINTGLAVIYGEDTAKWHYDPPSSKAGRVGYDLVLGEDVLHEGVNFSFAEGFFNAMLSEVSTAAGNKIVDRHADTTKVDFLQKELDHQIMLVEEQEGVIRELQDAIRQHTLLPSISELREKLENWSEHRPFVFGLLRAVYAANLRGMINIPGSIIDDYRDLVNTEGTYSPFTMATVVRHMTLMFNQVLYIYVLDKSGALYDIPPVQC